MIAKSKKKEKICLEKAPIRMDYAKGTVIITVDNAVATIEIADEMVEVLLEDTSKDISENSYQTFINQYLNEFIWRGKKKFRKAEIVKELKKSIIVWQFALQEVLNKGEVNGNIVGVFRKAIIDFVSDSLNERVQSKLNGMVKEGILQVECDIPEKKETAVYEFKLNKPVVEDLANGDIVIFRVIDSQTELKRNLTSKDKSNSKKDVVIKKNIDFIIDIINKHKENPNMIVIKLGEEHILCTIKDADESRSKCNRVEIRNCIRTILISAGCDIE